MDKPQLAEVSEFSVVNGERRYSLHELPTYCPRCRSSAIPLSLGHCTTEHFDDDFNFFYLSLPVKCSACRSVYIAEYRADSEPPAREDFYFELFAISPRSPLPTVVSDILKAISKQFPLIYDQARAAESQRLMEVAGAGYRRALEFLVKDYLIYKAPHDKEKFLRTALRSCIKDHIQHDTIRDLAERAASLGNDFVHYQSYAAADIKDLFALIELTRRWIELQEETTVVQGRLIST